MRRPTHGRALEAGIDVAGGRAVASGPQAHDGSPRAEAAGAAGAPAGVVEAVGPGPGAGAATPRAAGSQARSAAPRDGSRAARAGSGAAGPHGDGLWEAFVERVRGAQPALASVLEHGRVLAFGREGARLAFPRRSFFWETLSDPEERGQVEAHLVAHLGEGARLELCAQVDGADEEGADSLAERRQRQDRADADGLEARARRHPEVVEAVSLLGASVLAVRPADS